MSDAKRDNQAFRFTAEASHAGQRTRTQSAASAQTARLEVLELAAPWGSRAARRDDPYNTVGNRAATGYGRR